ncbi:proteasome regulatory particle base subunit [Coemansia spiralis]|uniref:26S proteasome regulatory subunit RPN1 n=2 Tax=Coemansia TaxID=4863 RepID=A0A9W8GEI5_9FUNG|nr:26S proteasome regulatory complex, non-ATPase subcomplex, Rpn1 subunit [Coemansia spiralis]KAJ1995976.1 proteasome regulatory particle base subunit [Coemansia umbellata]KAJ2625420.1 proteasome regulatory particle base subunit [Coemansia sp. RSA 1358]KAJ2680543.1 proteasome regulatory particle base subunit [Coemansia spiralis]
MVEKKPITPSEDVLNPKTAAEKLTKKKAKEQQDELSEEDQQLVNELQMIVDRLKEPSTEIHQSALENLRNIIRSTTGSMTSVPKPLKYLKAHYETLTGLYDSWSDPKNKKLLASILSLLGMAYDKGDKRDCLKYRLLAGYENGTVSEWGHEYVRHIAMEVGAEYAEKADEDDKEAETEQLLNISLEIIPFFLKHNAEADAVDLLSELDHHELIADFVSKETFERVCLYMISCSPLLAPPADLGFLETARKIYHKFGKPSQCLPLSIKLGRPDMIKEDWESCSTRLDKAQLAFIMARQQVHMPELIDDDDDELLACMNNSNLSKNYLDLARDLELLDPKSPEDIYKSHLENTNIDAALDSARHNLASTFVNAFVNAGYGTDKLMTANADGNEWIYKNKDLGMLSAAASLGMIMLWDVEVGLNQIDKYLYTNDNSIKSGAILAIGMLTSSVHDETDSAKALLSDYITEESNPAIVKLAAISGIGMAYAGTNREDIVDILLPIVSDTEITIDLSSIAALSAGLVCIGSGNSDVSTVILQAMMERMDSELNHKYARFMALGLALLYLGSQGTYDAILETLKAITHPISKQASVLIQVCAFAGSGNVLEVQKMLHMCAEHLGEKEDQLPQAFAVLGVGLIAMGEGIGSEMALRTFDHLMHYGEPYVRRAVPLAIALVCASNPLVGVLDTLNKFSHDNDKAVATSAVFAMGIVGAGTNNARLAQLLRQLATYYHRDADMLFTVRIAQGLLHMGKGTMSVNPYHHDRSLLSHTALAGLLIPLVAMINAEKLIITDSHFLLYYLVRAMYPRFLITFDENLESVSASVRVGQAVDAVGQVGRPKTITGFQTHDTPVLLAHSERAELATDKYIPLTNVLEGFVILKKNPEYQEEESA